MLRVVLGPGRRRREVWDPGGDADLDMHVDDETVDAESLVDWLKRAIRTIEEQLCHLDIENYAALNRPNKWGRARELAGQDTSSLSFNALQWEPGRTQQKQGRVGRPSRRWGYYFHVICTRCFGDSNDGNWEEIADIPVV
eukprot:5108929-Pyramimonas_sp.AAC.1